jgi:hypothetical protein
VKLLVQNAAASSHPLNVAGADNTALASGIAMLHLTLIDDGHGFESTMWMLADSPPLMCGLEAVWAGVVEQ